MTKSPKAAGRPRVCHVAASANGATWMVEQLRGLRDQGGYDVSAIIATGPGELGEKLAREGIPFQTFEFGFPALSDWGSLLKRVLALAHLLRAERYDIVQTHLFASMVMVRLAAWLADVPVRLAMVAGPYHLEARTPRWIDISTSWMETQIIASCDHSRSLYLREGVPEARLAPVIYYGPDATKFSPETTAKAGLRSALGLSPDTKLVGMVAYFYPKLPASSWTPEVLHDRANKRHEDLIRAAPAILREYPNTRILIVGSGWGEAGETLLRETKELVASLSLQDRVLFLGFRNDVNSILADLDVAVQASLSENLGGTIESLLMCCPTVATRTGGLVDAVRDGQTGITVAPLDPQDLARGVVSLLRDPEKAHRMAQNGRRLMLKEFTLERTVGALCDLYEHHLSGRRHKTRRGGYRLHKSMLRALTSVPVFAYLAGRLTWDTKWLPAYRCGWRPFPIPQLRRLASEVRNAAAAILRRARYTAGALLHRAHPRLASAIRRHK